MSRFTANRRLNNEISIWLKVFDSVVTIIRGRGCVLVPIYPSLAIHGNCPSAAL